MFTTVLQCLGVILVTVATWLTATRQMTSHEHSHMRRVKLTSAGRAYGIFAILILILTIIVTVSNQLDVQHQSEVQQARLDEFGYKLDSTSNTIVSLRHALQEQSEWNSGEQSALREHVGTARREIQDASNTSHQYFGYVCLRGLQESSKTVSSGPPFEAQILTKMIY